jgi:hypothetical protein
MGAPTSEVGYTSATTKMGDHEVYMDILVALGKKIPNLKHKQAYVKMDKTVNK